MNADPAAFVVPMEIKAELTLRFDVVDWVTIVNHARAMYDALPEDEKYKESPDGIHFDDDDLVEIPAKRAVEGIQDAFIFLLEHSNAFDGPLYIALHGSSASQAEEVHDDDYEVEP